MYKRDLIITIIILIILTTISCIFKVTLKPETITDFITFITVYLGFIMTTFAIMADNIEIKKLNIKKDPEDNYLMLNGRLANYFKFTFGFGLTAIILLLITDLFNISFISSKIILGLVVAMGFTSKIPIKLLFDIFLNKRVD